MKQGTGFATGKLILSGEHSVVYGAPAIVTALDSGIRALVQTSSQLSTHNQKMTRTQGEYLDHILSLFSQEFGVDTKDLFVFTESQLFSRSGQGSSAAFAAAVFRALANYFSFTLTTSKLFELTFLAEKYIHGNPSGIDPFAVVYGKTHLFQKQTEGYKKKPLSVKKPITFVLLHSGQASETTGQMVELVASKYSESARKSMVSKMGELTHKTAQSLRDGTFSGDLLDQNQAYLEELGVVGSRAQKMITEVQKIGGNAKITGAGGVATGSGWVLAYAPDISKLQRLAEQKGWENCTSTVQ